MNRHPGRLVVFLVRVDRLPQHLLCARLVEDIILDLKGHTDAAGDAFEPPKLHLRCISENRTHHHGGLKQCPGLQLIHKLKLRLTERLSGHLDVDGLTAEHAIDTGLSGEDSRRLQYGVGKLR